MTNSSMAINRLAVGQTTFDISSESFHARNPEHCPKSVKDHRKEFANRLQQIRSRCEVSYHKELLEYFPNHKPRQLPSSTAAGQEKGIWYTDPHLLCRRSDAAPLLHSLHQVLGRCTYAVSVGDEWDFGWSQVPDPIRTAVNYKVRLARRYPNCKFIVVSGNHDGSEEYINALKDAAEETTNIEVHRYAAKIGKYLFTHGDCVHWPKPTVKALDEYRLTYNNGWRPNFAERCFDHLTYKLGLHWKVPEHLLELLIPRKVQAERILAFIKQLDIGLLEGVQTICFGHTHKGFRGFKHAGFKFSNGGSHEQGFRPSLHRFTIYPTDSDLITNLETKE